MISKKHGLILAELRKNPRQHLSGIAKKLGMKRSTMHEHYKQIMPVIKSCHALVDFSMLGYSFRMNFIFKVDDWKVVSSFIACHKNINHVQVINSKKTLMVWGVFRSIAEAYEFREELERRGITNIRESHVLEDISREKMLSQPLSQ